MTDLVLNVSSSTHDAPDDHVGANFGGSPDGATGDTADDSTVEGEFREVNTSESRS